MGGEAADVVFAVAAEEVADEDYEVLLLAVGGRGRGTNVG